MGFFTSAELSKAKVIPKLDQLEPNCKKCELHLKCKHPKIGVTGQGKKKILIIGGASTYDEDLYGTAFSGESSFILKKQLQKNNIILNRDCWKVNAVACASVNYFLPPKTAQIQCCYPKIKKIILELKPTTIILCGPIAITSLFGKNFSNRTVDRWRMYCIPDEKFKCNIIPILHPEDLSEKDINEQKQYERDLQRVGYLVTLPYKPRVDYESYVTLLTDYTSVKKQLKRVLKEKLKIAFDYETTGLKPYTPGHKIVTIGFAVSETEAYAFPFDYKTFWTKEEFSKIKRLWWKILKNKKIDKIAHNVKFETIWSKKILKATPKCHFDTMIGAHILDNRSNSLGLKFQTFVNFGVRPYDEHIKPFLESKNGEFNTIEKAPFKELLLYNGLDCVFTFMLYEKFILRLTKNRNLLKAYNFSMRGISVMGKIQSNGILCNLDYYKKTEKQLQKKVDDAKEYLSTGREATRFKKRYKRDIKITSNQDLGKLFYDVLGKPPITTEKGAYKVDKITMQSLNLPFVDKLLEMKKYEKARGTYLGQFLREITKNKIHPFFDLHIPVTYRSSSSMPNFQNIPKRNPEIGHLIRKGIIPRKKRIIIEADFGGAEVITSAAYHKDPQFIHDISVGDMHRDLTVELWNLEPKLMDKRKNPNYTDKEFKMISNLRFYTKNNWTFAQLYGDYFVSCAKLLWENCIDNEKVLPNGHTVKSWIAENGIYELGEIESDGRPTPGSFMEHCKNVENRMWNKRWPVYTKWKKDIIKFYQEYGYIENFFGFRFSGYMGKNQCCNFPIQSTSFQLLLHTLIELSKFLRKNKLKTLIIGQVHDSIILDAPVNEVKFVLNRLNKIVTGLKDTFKWLPIPMEIEFELSKTREEGGNFAELKERTLQYINENY
jgi:DNA polymerase-1